jgi:hypothetical protein
MISKTYSSNDPTDLMNFQSSSMNKFEGTPDLFQKSDSEVFKDCLWDHLQQNKSDSQINNFVDEDDQDVSDLSDFAKPKEDFKPQVDDKDIFEGRRQEDLPKKSGSIHNTEATPKFVKNDNEKVSKLVTAPIAKMLEGIKQEVNCRKPTMDISDYAKSLEASSPRSEYTPYSNGKRKPKRRRDVIFKTILRE